MVQHEATSRLDEQIMLDPGDGEIVDELYRLVAQITSATMIGAGISSASGSTRSEQVTDASG
jgi:hypothetical protein